MNKQALYTIVLCIFFQGFMFGDKGKDCKKNECPRFQHLAAGALFGASALFALGSALSFNVIAHNGNSLTDTGLFTLIGSMCLAAGTGCAAGCYLIEAKSQKSLYECLEEYWMRGEEDLVKIQKKLAGDTVKWQKKLHEFKEKIVPSA